MTEAEWLAGEDPAPLLEWARGGGGPGDRKLLLFLCACGRRLGPLLTDERSLEAIRVVERFADSAATKGEVMQALQGAEAAMEDFKDADDVDPHLGAAIAAHDIAWSAASGVDIGFVAGLANAAAEAAATASTDAMPEVTREAWESARLAEKAGQAALLREVLGNPFRPAAVDPAWRTPSVLALARAIDQGPAFERMPQLADALAEAGCGDPAVLSHGRSPAGHVRGCWLVDALLGRA
jgi:hypothetical protein